MRIKLLGVIWMAFTERDALKLRLVQIDDSEKRVMGLYNEERELIYKRFRELDSIQLSDKSDDGVEKKSQSSLNNKRVRRRPYNKKPLKAQKADKAAIEFLRQQSATVPFSLICEEVEKQTGEKIQNGSQFMQRLMKMDSNITKPYRGQYFYNQNSLEEKVL
jgi:Na+-transporting NADH:ubiquinone oxidoreductase subunit NqrA